MLLHHGARRSNNERQHDYRWRYPSRSWKPQSWQVS
jgi:hypothetical protein